MYPRGFTRQTFVCVCVSSITGITRKSWTIQDGDEFTIWTTTHNIEIFERAIMI